MPMDEWFDRLVAELGTPSPAMRRLLEEGFAVIPGPAPDSRLDDLAGAYDKAVLAANAADVARGSTTTRVHDLVNRGAEFDSLYVHPPLLEACCRRFGVPFKLSSMLARTLHPGAQAQGLHVDVPGHDQGWTMLGFIFMVDEFRPENGATRLLPRSQETQDLPVWDASVPACGPTGSMILYDGSIWHGHGANLTERPRRSIQGACIPRTAKSSGTINVRPETLDRISPLARYLLDCP
jgi:hypothetical protein